MLREALTLSRQVRWCREAGRCAGAERGTNPQQTGALHVVHPLRRVPMAHLVHLARGSACG